MKIIAKKLLVNKVSSLLLLSALMFSGFNARAGMMENTAAWGDFNEQAAEISMSVKAFAGNAELIAPQSIAGITEPVSVNNKYLKLDDLRALLRDSNPEVRKAAVRSAHAKGLISNRKVYERLIVILQNADEYTDIRVEAARSLSYAGRYDKVEQALARVGKNSAELLEIRVMAYKALWYASKTDSKVQKFLMDAVRYG